MITAKNNNNRDDVYGIQNAIEVIDVNSYKIRYCDYYYTKGVSEADSSKNMENQAENCQKIVVLLQERAIEEWLYVASILARKGFRLLIPELIEFRYNKDKSDIDHMNDFFIDGFIKAFLNRLDISKASIIGYSFSVHIATDFAIRFSDMVEKLVLVSPEDLREGSKSDRYIIAALYPEVTEAVYETFREMIHDPNTLNKGIVTDFVNWMSLPNAKYRFISTVLAARHAAKLKPRFSSITVPTLLVWGDNDRMIPSSQYKQQYDGIPIRKHVLIKDCGHIPNIEKPVELCKSILDFLLDENRQEGDKLPSR